MDWGHIDIAELGTYATFLFAGLFTLYLLYELITKIINNIRLPFQKATIIGYRFSHKPFVATPVMPTRFYPVIRLEDGTEIAVKKMSALIKQGRNINIKLKKDRYIDLNLAPDILPLGFIFIFALAYFKPFEALNTDMFFYLSFGVLSAAILINHINTRREFDYLGEKQISKITNFKKPADYSKLTADDIARIENADLVDVKDVEHHYYYSMCRGKVHWFEAVGFFGCVCYFIKNGFLS